MNYLFVNIQHKSDYMFTCLYSLNLGSTLLMDENPELRNNKNNKSRPESDWNDRFNIMEQCHFGINRILI